MLACASGNPVALKEAPFDIQPVRDTTPANMMKHTEHFNALPIDGIGRLIRIRRTWTTSSNQAVEPPSTSAGRSRYTMSDGDVEDLGGNRFKVAGKVYRRTR